MKTTIVLIALLTLGLLLVGCGPQQAPPVDTGDNDGTTGDSGNDDREEDSDDNAEDDMEDDADDDMEDDVEDDAEEEDEEKEMPPALPTMDFGQDQNNNLGALE